MKDLTKTESDLLSLVANALFDSPVDLSNMDWEAVEKEANLQAVFLIAFHKHFNEAKIEHIKQKFGIMTSKNLGVIADHIYTHNLMAQNDIPYVILKGYSASLYYPDPIYRSMGDVDFLVSTDDFDRAKALLENEGFKAIEENNCHIAYQNGSKDLELHFKPAGMPEGEFGEIVKGYFDDVFEKAEEKETIDGKIIVPSAFHHGLILLLHTYHHLIGEGVGLRHLCDWAVLANSMSNKEFEACFKDKLQRVGLWRFAQLLTQLSIKYLHMPEKAWAMENVDDALLNDMICDIFAGGNFGVKDKSRSTETLIISSRGKNGVGETSAIKQFVKSINDIVYLNWRATQKHKLLLPLGWLFYGGRYIFRIIIGKRDKIDVSKTIENANERKALYKEFHLYETNNGE